MMFKSNAFKFSDSHVNLKNKKKTRRAHSNFNPHQWCDVNVLIKYKNVIVQLMMLNLSVATGKWKLKLLLLLQNFPWWKCWSFSVSLLFYPITRDKSWTFVLSPHFKELLHHYSNEICAYMPKFFAFNTEFLYPHSDAFYWCYFKWLNTFRLIICLTNWH